MFLDRASVSSCDMRLRCLEFEGSNPFRGGGWVSGAVRGRASELLCASCLASRDPTLFVLICEKDLRLIPCWEGLIGRAPTVGAGPAANSSYLAVCRKVFGSDVLVKSGLLLLLLRRKNLLNPDSIDHPAVERQTEAVGKCHESSIA